MLRVPPARAALRRLRLRNRRKEGFLTVVWNILTTHHGFDGWTADGFMNEPGPATVVASMFIDGRGPSATADAVMDEWNAKQARIRARFAELGWTV